MGNRDGLSGGWMSCVSVLREIAECSGLDVMIR